MTPDEVEVLQSWLAHDVNGAGDLREQLASNPSVFSSCDCGCASIGFHWPEVLERVPGVGVFDVDAEIVDELGAPLGGMVLLLKDGRLHDVDVHSWTDGPQTFPALSQIRGHLRS